MINELAFVPRNKNFNRLQIWPSGDRVKSEIGETFTSNLINGDKRDREIEKFTERPRLGNISRHNVKLTPGVSQDCTVISGTRLTPSKPFASVLVSSVRLGLARCGDTTYVIVSSARTTPDMSPAGVPASPTRSTADVVPPPAWPRLPLLHLRRGGWRDKPGCCSSATGGRHHRVRHRRAS
jgi:hypothetical protein